MSFFNKLFNKSNQQEPFLGDWVVDNNDLNSINELGDVKMSFKKDGSLVYEIRGKDKSQFIFMTFSIKDGRLITDQPSHPQKEETYFIFETPTVLVLEFNGVATRFIKK